jgi:hypothetical protein
MFARAVGTCKSPPANDKRSSILIVLGAKKMPGPARKGLVAAVFALTTVLSIASATSAESLLPLNTETAGTLPKGMAEAVLGASYFEDLRFPPFTPADALRRQHLTMAPEFALRAAAGRWAEIQASFDVVTVDERTTEGETTRNTGAGDAQIGTKMRVMSENSSRPALGIRFVTKLPNANVKNRLGTDEADFHFQGLISKNFGPLAAHVNVGMSLLGNPGPVLGAADRSTAGQDDLLNYSVALVSRPLSVPVRTDYLLRLFTEVGGLANSRFGNDRSAARFGLQTRHGALTTYSGVSAGLITASENFGLAAGVIYTFDVDRLFGITE